MRVVYETDGGKIRNFEEDGQTFGGLNATLSIGQSATAKDTEKNVSEIPDLRDVTEDCAVYRDDREPGLRTAEQLALRKLAKAVVEGKSL